MTTEIAIQINSIEKSFGDKSVLKGVSLEVAKGSVFALLGINGAGKTTLINLLTTLTAQSGGRAIVAGYDIQESADMVRESIAVTGQNTTVDTVLTGYENLVLVGKLHHISDPNKTARQLLERFNLKEAGDKPTETYSGGMKRRLDIALSLIGNPKVIFLDEPSTGLDPAGRREVWNTIDDLAQSGITIFLTTQHMEEAEHLADTIAILHDGRIIVEGDKATILAASGNVKNLEEAFLVLTSKEKSPLLSDKTKSSPSKEKQSLGTMMKQTGQTAKHHPFKDTWTLTARMLKHNIRSMDTIMTVLGMPLLILLAFVFVLGGAMNTGDVRYIDFIVPTVLLLCIASGVAYTAFRVNADVQSGMFDRFRTMPIARLSLIGGHALSSVIINAVSCIALLLIALFIGYRPQADLFQWIIASGLLIFTLISFASMGVAFGIIAKSPEGSGMFSYLIMGLLFVSSGFVPTSTMPAPLQVFAEYQPMTPLINSIRNTLLGQNFDSQIWIALFWLIVVVIVFSLLSLKGLRKQKL